MGFQVLSLFCNQSQLDATTQIHSFFQCLDLILVIVFVSCLSILIDQLIN